MSLTLADLRQHNSNFSGPMTSAFLNPVRRTLELCLTRNFDGGWGDLISVRERNCLTTYFVETPDGGYWDDDVSIPRGTSRVTLAEVTVDHTADEVVSYYMIHGTEHYDEDMYDDDGLIVVQAALVGAHLKGLHEESDWKCSARRSPSEGWRHFGGKASWTHVVSSEVLSISEG